MATHRSYRALIFITIILAWMGNKIGWQIRTDLASGLPYGNVIDRALNDLLTPWHLSINPYDLLTGIGFAATGALVWFNNDLKHRQRREGEEHGSARWGTIKDFAPFAAPRRSKRHRKPDRRIPGLLFTREQQLNLDSRTTQRNLNALIIGGSGSGKSRYVVKPNLYNMASSFAVTDPKGELLRDSATHLHANGYTIRCLNLVDFTRSDHFNPFVYFNPDQPEVDASILTENFISNTNGSKPSSGDGFWEKAERALLNALIAYNYAINARHATLIDVVDQLATMQASENDENAKSDVDLTFEAAADLVAEYDAHPERFEGEAIDAINGLRFAASQYNTYTQGAGETKKSVIISLGVRMAPLHMAQIRDLLSYDTMHLDRIGYEKTALFLVIPDTHATFSFLVSIFYEQLFETNLYMADHAPDGHLPIQVQCFMDEFANIGKMPSFERKIAVMRSRWISTVVIVQNFSQGKALYKDDWETIVGNCDSLLFLGGNEKSTTEYVSKILGKQTISATDTSQSKGRNGSYSVSDKRLGRELLTPDEIGRIPTDRCIYVLRGVAPFYSHKLTAPPDTAPYTYTPAVTPQEEEAAQDVDASMSDPQISELPSDMIDEAFLEQLDVPLTPPSPGKP